MLRVVLPERCVHAEAAQTCSLFIDHHRARKTGPCFPLAVVGCSVHALGRYTLYPAGHVPYGREAVVPCSPSGPLLRDPTTGQPVWQKTLFEAATDAAERQWWLDHWSADDYRRRRTQGRRLEQAGKLLGIHPDIGSSEQQRIATRLGVPTMTLRTAAGNWASRWQAHGTAIGAVLHALPLDNCLLDRLLAAGAVTGLWASPQRWDAARRTWVRCRAQRLRSRSKAPEQPVAAPLRNRAPPPTTLRTPGSTGAEVSSVA